MIESAVLVINTDSLWLLNKDDFAGKFRDAVATFQKTKKPVPIYLRALYSSTSVAWVIGKGMKEEAQVFVVREHTGRAVTGDQAHKDDLEAMVNVLRRHGYTCIKRD